MADLGPLSREELIAVVEGQRRLIAELTAEIERLKRAQNRSAAPFSKNKPKADPQRPGRRPGQGPFLRRTEPVQLTSTTVVADTFFLTLASLIYNKARAVQGFRGI